ncbi:MAG: FCD domain-containing protein [Maricaulaceae bacterium]
MGESRFVYQKTVRDIMKLIDSGVCALEGRLPATRDLALQLGVSRTVVREALIALQAQDILIIKPRSGAYIVNKPKLNSQGLPQIKSFELAEAHALIAVECAAMAVSMITEDMTLEMETYIPIMSGRTQDDMSPLRAYVEFHTVIAKATQNEVIITMMETMWKKRKESCMLENISVSNLSQFEDDHIAILDALKNKDSAYVKAAMKAHFSHVMEALIIASEKEAYEKIKNRASETRSRFLLVSQFS